jgi:hypothetical protein
VVTVPIDGAEFTGDYADDLDPDWTFVSDSDLAIGVSAEDVNSGVIDPANISCSRVYSEPPPDPLPDANEFEFSDEPYTIECTAMDDAGNEGTASYPLTVRYLYDIEVTVGKIRVKLGSTIPFDWLYRDSAGNLVDSSHLQPDIGITWATTSDCIKPDNTGPSGEDSGSSAFRYSAADGIWQYSLQTKDLMGDGQQYLVSIVPPGVGVESATPCVTLR